MHVLALLNSLCCCLASSRHCFIQEIKGHFANPENDTVLSPQGWVQEGFALSYHEEIHAFILEYMYTLCFKAFVYSFKTFYKLEKTAITVFYFMSNYKYEKIVCYVYI